ncbi:MAG: amidophosphoribosyltransferase [Pseudobdellovibrionaceae bacterium]
MGEFREECGVFAVTGHPEAARLTYLGLYAQQHRGQESCGITVPVDEVEHWTEKGLGLVGDVFTEEKLSRLQGVKAIGHVRYSTTGSNSLLNAQPLSVQVSQGPVSVAHNGNLTNASVLRKQLQAGGSILSGSNDTEVVLHLISRAQEKEFDKALIKALHQIQGAYSFVFLAEGEIWGVRDPHGFRPLVIGKLEESYFLASETCALDLIGAEFVREVLPGEIVKLTSRGIESLRFAEARPSYCVFEHVYFSRPDSIVFGRSVYQSRKLFGEELAKESQTPADLVIPVPDSGVAAALGFSQSSGIPFDLGIIRNHYIGRTFIQPVQTVRDFAVKVKLNPQTAVFKGKKVILIDDSLVRGTTSRKIVQMVRAAGASEVHLKIAAPPTTGPCYYGVDTPQAAELIASHKTQDEIRDFLQVDTLQYLTMEGLLRAVSASEKDRFCAACFDGKYPTQ